TGSRAATRAAESAAGPSRRPRGPWRRPQAGAARVVGRAPARAAPRAARDTIGRTRPCGCRGARFRSREEPAPAGPPPRFPWSWQEWTCSSFEEPRPRARCPCFRLESRSEAGAHPRAGLGPHERAGVYGAPIHDEEVRAVRLQGEDEASVEPVGELVLQCGVDSGHDVLAELPARRVAAVDDVAGVVNSVVAPESQLPLDPELEARLD